MKQLRFTKLSILVTAFLFISKSANCQTTTFSYGDSIQTYMVPAGVSSLSVDMSGAAGGDSYHASSEGPGSNGGRVRCKLIVTPGQTMYIYVGGKGANWTTTTATIGGFNGGAPGGSFAACGGGASDIRIGDTSLTSRVVVAGGGGGGGDFDKAGGAGGGLTGGTGSLGACGGGQTSPGCTTGYSLGTFGFGGVGASYSTGGGGGGWWGGNAGVYADGGGGGGSSYTNSTLTSSVIHTQGDSLATGNGIVILTVLDHIPAFINGSSQTTSVCENSNIDISSLLIVSDVDSGQNEKITVISAPANGMLTGFPDSVISSGGYDTSGGYTYTPNAAFSGIDSFKIQVNDNNGGTATTTIIITVNTLPAIVTGSTDTICPGSTATLTASGGTSYSWSPSTGLTITTGASVAASPTVTTVYTVTGSDGTCSNTAAQMVRLNIAPSVTMGSSPAVCAGASNASFSITSGVYFGPAIDTTFSYIDTIQTYIIPAGVSSFVVDAIGAAGGDSYQASSEGPGSNGGRVQCDLTVTPGQTLFIYAGGKGPNWTSTILSAGGFNGGGGGGSFAASGGGASDIRVGDTALTSRIVVAGGGGGGGDFDAPGGAGGGLTGGTGQATNFGSGVGAGACGGGQTGPGCTTGHALGTFGKGSTPGIYSVGGGGGGWWGGNSGVSSDGGAGGGSSYTDPVHATNVIHTQGYSSATGNGTVRLSTPAVTNYIYSITWDSAALANGFTNTSGDTLRADTINFSMPTSAAAAYYSATLALNNGICTSTYPVGVTVKPIPVLATPTNQILCGGQAAPAVTFNSSVAGTVYTWANNDTAIGLAASGTGNISSFIPVDTTFSIDTATVTVTPISSGCIGTSQNFLMIVKPTPAVSLPYSQSVCNAASTITVTFNALLSGTTFSWTNSDPTIGIAATGINYVPSFTAINTSSVIDTAWLTVTPAANGCTGTAQNFMIIVDPTPTVAIPLDQALCSGTATGAVNFTGTVSGTTYTWVNSDTAIGLAAVGADSVVSFIAMDTLYTIDTATITITPMANSCSGMAQNFHIIVNPIPAVSSPATQYVCNNVPTATINFSSLVSGTTYTWTNSDTLIGLVAMGMDSIGSFTPVNTTSGIDTVVIMVTPNANSCTGTAQHMMMMVNPTPNVATISNQIHCNGAMTDSIMFAGSVPGTVFNWNNSMMSIGIDTTGTGNILPFTATDTTSSIDTALITIRPVANGCIGATDSFWIIVYPTPHVNHIASITACNSSTVPTQFFTSPVAGSSFAWTNNNTATGISGSGMDSIASFTATDTTIFADSSVIAIVPSANGCTGITDTLMIEVYPTPKVMHTPDHVVCNIATDSVNFTGPVVGTTYSWTNSMSSIGIATTGSGNIGVFTASDTFYVIDTAVIKVLPGANGCTGARDSFRIIVNPTPEVIIPVNSPYCNGSIVSTISFTGPVAGSSFAWTNTDTTTGIGAGGMDSIGMLTVRNTNSFPDSAIISVTPSANGCIGNTDTMIITVNPTPKLSDDSNVTICSETLLIYTPHSPTTGTSFTGSRATIGHIVPAGISGFSSINETLKNDTLVPVTVAYVYTLTANGCSNTETLNVIVDPAPHAPSITTYPPTNLCSNTLYQNFGTSTAPSPGEHYSWSANNAEVWASGNNHQYSLVNFRNSGTSKVILSVNMSGIACYHADTFTVNVGTEVSVVPIVIYYNNNFICLLNDQDSYQWGYDDKATLDSSLIDSATNQSYYDPLPDYVNKSYWVITKSGDCMEKTYYTTPTQLGIVSNDDRITVYPNPAAQEVNVDITTSGKDYTEVKMFDITGQSLKTTPVLNNKAVLDVSALAPGIYMLGCYRDGIQVTTVKFVKI